MPCGDPLAVRSGGSKRRTALTLIALVLAVTMQSAPALDWLGWSVDGDWATGNFSNTTSVNGVLQVNKSFYREYEPLNAKTSAWWHFNEGSGPLASDSSGNGNAGNLGNGSLWNAPSWVAGRFGHGLNFNGSQYVNVSNSASLNAITSAITVEAWVNLNETQTSLTGNDTYAAVLRKESSFYIQAYTNSTGAQRAGFWVHVNGIWFGASIADDLRGTGWHMLAGTYDGSMVKFYLDGVAKASTSVSGQIDTSSDNMFIGSYNGTSRFFNGMIDEVRILNESIYESDIALDYVGYFKSASYKSNTTDFGRPIASAVAFFDKNEYNNFNGILNLTNLTVEISVNNGTTWRPVAQSGVGISTVADAGTRLTFRVNFTTNDTRRTATMSAIVLLPTFLQNAPPNVTLVAPLNAYSAANDVGLVFTCSAADDAGLAAISLWHNMTGVWQQNVTTQVNGTSNSTSFAVNGTFGNFTWNCMATDSEGQGSFAPSNFTFALASTPTAPSLSMSFSPSSTVSVGQGENGTVIAQVTSSNALATNVSLSFTESACCAFSHFPAMLDVPQMDSRNFTIIVSVLEGATPAQFSTVVSASSSEGVVVSAPLTISVLPKAESPTPSPTLTPSPTPLPSPTPDQKIAAQAAIDEANFTILSVDIAIAAAEREKKDVRLAVSRLAEARGLLKRAYSLMSGEFMDYEGAQKAAKDATTRANEALAAIPEKGRSLLADMWIIVPIIVLVSAIGFVAYNALFGPKKKMQIASTYQPTQQQYYQYYKNYPYYYRPQQPSQQQPMKPK